MKKIIALALALIMVLSMGTVAFAAGVSNATDLQTAFNAGGTVTLGANIDLSDGDATFTIPEGKDVVLDLNGYSITSTLSNTIASSYTLIENKGSLTVTGDGNITVDYSGSSFGFGKGLYTIGNRGTLSIEDDAVIENISNISASMYSAIDNYTGGTANIEGGEVSCPNYVAIRLFATSETVDNKVVINDGTVTGKFAIFVQDSGNGDRKATVVINDGEVTGSADAFYITDDGSADNDAEGIDISISGGEVNGEFTLDMNENEAANIGVEISGGSFTDDVTEFLAPGAQLGADGNIYTDAVPGETITVSTDYARADWKVKSYDFTTGTRGFNGASYIDEIKITKENKLVIVLKDNYKLAEDKLVKGEIILQNKETKAEVAVPVFYTVANNVHETYGERKPSEAIEVPEGENQVILMDEDGGYVYFTEEMLKGVVKMNKEEKTFLNVIYGGQEETIDAIEELLGEEYLDEAIIEYYEFETRAFKNEVAFSYEAYEDDPHYFYLYNDGKLTKIDAKYNDDEEVEAWEWTAIAEGTIIVTDVEIVLADETTKNPDTGANDVVGVAAALAVVSIISAAAVAIKK